MTIKFLWRMHGERWERAMEKISDNPLVKSIKNSHIKYLREKSKSKKDNMKKIICLLMLMTGSAQAQEVIPNKTSLFNFGDFFANVRGGYAINQHMQLSTVFYTPWKVFHTTDKLALASVNLGYDGLKKRPLVAIGLRLDNIDSLLWKGKWGKAHVSTAKLPSFELGPFVSMWPIKTDSGYKIDVSFGATAAIGFDLGGK